MKSNYCRTIFPLHSYETIQFSYNLLEVVYDIKNKFVITEASNIVCLYILNFLWNYLYFYTAMQYSQNFLQARHNIKYNFKTRYVLSEMVRQSAVKRRNNDRRLWLRGGWYLHGGGSDVTEPQKTVNWGSTHGLQRGARTLR